MAKSLFFRGIHRELDRIEREAAEVNDERDQLQQDLDRLLGAIRHMRAEPFDGTRVDQLVAVAQELEERRKEEQ